MLLLYFACLCHKNRIQLPPRGANRKPREACAREARPVACHTREHHRARPARKLSLDRALNLSFLFSPPERHEIFPLIPHFACTSRGDPREAISRSLTTSRGIAPSGLVRAQIQLPATVLSRSGAGSQRC